MDNEGLKAKFADLCLMVLGTGYAFRYEEVRSMDVGIIEQLEKHKSIYR